MPAAYWRLESVLADHSGIGHHLDWAEDYSAAYSTMDTTGVPSTISYTTAVDGLPEDIQCTSPSGLGCTAYEDSGYATDKFVVDARWSGTNFSRGGYELSESTPPPELFNPEGASPAQTITTRSSLYDVQPGVLPVAGNSSFHPGSISSTAALFFNHRRGSNSSDSSSNSSSPFNFDDDFTVELFFRTDGDQSSGAEMDLIYQATAGGNYTEYSFRLTLNAAALEGECDDDCRKGSVSLSVTAALAGDYPPTSYTAHLPGTGTNYADGVWHYVVGRFSRESHGFGTESYLALRGVTLTSSTATSSTGVVTTSAVPDSVSVEDAEATIPAGVYMGGAAGATFIGGVSSRRLQGVVDEVRISAGLVHEDDLLGDTTGAVIGGGTASATGPGCAARTVLTERRGAITDGSIEQNSYLNGQDCEWLIAPDSAQHVGAFVALRFTSFSTEPLHDVVRIYDGNSTSAPLLAVLSGRGVPMNVPLVSSGGSLLVQFVTDDRQVSAQAGWAAEFESMSVRRSVCATANQGQNLTLSCPEHYQFKKVNFASYGTPLGFCGSTGANVGLLRDEANATGFGDISNPHGRVVSGPESGDGAGGVDFYTAAVRSRDNNGPINFVTGYCHSNFSKTHVEYACLGKSECTVAVSDDGFHGDPCVGMEDTKRGRATSDDASVAGADVLPFNSTHPSASSSRPYVQSTGAMKYLAVELTCEGTLTYASNCAEQCSSSQRCLYALERQFCQHCNESTLGMVPTTAGGFVGQGCGTNYCVRESDCFSLPPSEPLNVRLAVAGATMLNVTWDAPAEGFVFNYQLMWSTDINFVHTTPYAAEAAGHHYGEIQISGPPREQQGMAMQTVITDLTAGRTYYVFVHGGNGIGWGDRSGLAALNGGGMTPSAPPAPPASVYVGALHSAKDSLLVTFPTVACADPTTDPCNGVGVSRYRIEWASSTSAFSTESGYPVSLNGSFEMTDTVSGSDFAAAAEVLYSGFDDASAHNETTGNGEGIGWWWSRVSGGKVGTECGGRPGGSATTSSTSNALVFGSGDDAHTSHRFLETIDLDVSNNGTLSFFLKYGSNTDGLHSCTEVQGTTASASSSLGSGSTSGTDYSVELLFSTDKGQTWSVLGDYPTDNGGLFGAFTAGSDSSQVTVLLPAAACTTMTRFAWSQRRGPADVGDVTRMGAWAVDDVRVTLTNALSYRIAGLTTGDAYYIRVAAYSDRVTEAGYGAYSPTSSATPAGPPGAPATVVMDVVGRSSLRVNWTAVLCESPDTDLCHGAPAEKYLLQYSTAADFPAPSADISGSYAHSDSISTTVEFDAADAAPPTYSTILSSLETGASYYVRVFAVNAEGRSLYPTAAAAATDSSDDSLKPASAPLSPTGATLTVASPSSVHLSFQNTNCTVPSVDACNGQPVDLHLVEWSTDGSFPASGGSGGSAVLSGATNTSLTIVQLVTGTAYYVRVYAHNRQVSTVLYRTTRAAYASIIRHCR
jgi:hypothetical protein